MTMLELKEFENLEQLQSIFHNPKAVERLGRLGVRSAVVATWDGLLVDSVVCDDQPVELENLAANAAAALQLSHTHGAQARGRVHGVLAEYDGGGTIVVNPVGDNTLVAFVTRTLSDVTRLRTELKVLAGHPAHTLEAKAVETPTVRPPLHAPAMPRPVAPAPELRAAAPVQRPAPTHGYPLRRIVLKDATIDVSGFAATATVTLSVGGHRVLGKAVAKNDSEQLLYVAAEAAARAVTALLPAGYGVILESIKPVASEVDKDLKAVGVKVIFLTPSGEQTLLGIARIAESEPLAAAKTVLSAVNSRIETLFGEDHPVH